MMLSIIKKIFSRLRENKGQATVEYALIIVTVVLVVIIGLSNIADALVNFFNNFTAYLRL